MNTAVESEKNATTTEAPPVNVTDFVAYIKKTSTRQLPRSDGGLMWPQLIVEDLACSFSPSE